MSMSKISNLFKNLVHRGKGIVLTPKILFSTSSSYLRKDNNDKYTPRTEDALTFLSNILEDEDEGVILAGTGQYHRLKGKERVLLLNFGDNFVSDSKSEVFNTKYILECFVRRQDMFLFYNQIKQASRLPVFCGQLDFINSSTWRYGFTFSPFSVFSRGERVLFIKDGLIHICIRGEDNHIRVKDVEYVGLWVSHAPHNERRLIIGTKNKLSHTIIEVKEKNKKSKSDLFRLAVETEWMMKVSALLCLNLRREGNSDVHLRYSPTLTPARKLWSSVQNNEWSFLLNKDDWWDKDL